MSSSSPTILLTLMGLGVGGAETHVVVLAKNLKDIGYNIIVASGGGVYVKELTDYGIKHYQVNLKTKKLSAVIKSFISLINIVKSEKVNLIHAHARIPAFICNIVSKLSGVPFITTGHYNFKTNMLLKRLSPWGQKTIVVSQDLKEYFETAFNIPGKNIDVITNGIETERFKPGIECCDLYDEFRIDKSYTKILLVSRVDDNLASIMLELVDIADKLKSKFEKIAFFIVGSGNRLEEVNTYANNMNRNIGEKSIYVTGGRTDIDKMISFCDVFIGISRAALEAMSCEKPVIIAGAWSFVGILNEINLTSLKIDNFTGRSFSNPVSSELLYNAIVEVLTMEKEEKVRLGRLERQIVEEYYSSERMARSTARIYEEILGSFH